jgi:hypothetical protein
MLCCSHQFKLDARSSRLAREQASK